MPPQRLSVSVVLELIWSIPDDSPWTTSDVAARLNVPERSARAAVSWLIKRGDVESTGRSVRRFTARKALYWTTSYRAARKKGGGADWDLINRCFGLCK